MRDDLGDDIFSTAGEMRVAIEVRSKEAIIQAITSIPLYLSTSQISVK